MIPALVRLPRPRVAGRRDRAPAAPRRSGQGAVGRSEPAAAAQASPGRRRPPRRHRPDPRPRVHQGGRRVPEDRRAHARIAARALRDHQVEIPDSPRHRARDRGSAGAQPRDRRRQPRARRSGQRSPGHDARARRRGDGDGPEGPADDPDRSDSSRASSARRSRRTKSSPRSAFRSLRRRAAART